MSDPIPDPLSPAPPGDEMRAFAPAPPEAVPWTLRQTIVGTALTLGPWLLLAALSLLANKKSIAQQVNPVVDLLTGLLVFGVSAALEGVFLIAPLVIASRAQQTQGTTSARGSLAAGLRALGLRGGRPGQWALVIALALAVIIALSFAYDALVQALRLPLQTNTSALQEQAKHMPYTVMGTLLAGVLIAPFCEEVFFRGFLFPGLTRGMSLWAAVVISATLFGVAHADVGSFAPLVVIGLTLAVVRWKTDSLWPGVIVHFINNGIAFLSILLVLR